MITDYENLSLLICRMTINFWQFVESHFMFYLFIYIYLFFIFFIHLKFYLFTKKTKQTS